jgi:hypothetical protein
VLIAVALDRRTAGELVLAANLLRAFLAEDSLEPVEDE